MDKIGVVFFLEAGDEGQGGRHSDGVAAAGVADGGHRAAPPQPALPLLLLQ